MVVGRIVVRRVQRVLVDLFLHVHLFVVVKMMVVMVVRIFPSFLSSSHSDHVDMSRRQFGRDQVSVGGVEVVNIRILLFLFGVIVVVGMQWIFLGKSEKEGTNKD